MIGKINKNQERLKRHKRVRSKISGTADSPRLSVYRSLNHIYVQLIDDVKGNTLVTASTLDKLHVNMVKTSVYRKSRSLGGAFYLRPDSLVPF